MPDQKFAVQKQIFEVEAFSKECAHELQNRISHLVNYRLVKKMENYFDEIIPDDLLLRIDQLVLDIGEVNWISMEDEIEERLMEALEYEFMQRLRLARSDENKSLSGISFETTGNGKLALLEYFLLYGLLPWYADTGIKFSIDEVLNQLYNENRPALKSLIQRTGKHLNVRKRISYQFSDKSVQQVIDTIEPVEAGYIFATHQELCKVQKEKQVLQAEEKEFSQALWLFIMNYLLAEKSSEFERKMFVKSNLVQIAAYYNINYRDMLYNFYDILETDTKVKIFEPLKTLVYELFFAETQSPITEKLSAENTQTTEVDMLTLLQKLELLQYYLHVGSLPIHYEKMSQAELTSLLLNMAKLAPVTVRELLLSLSKKNANLFYLYQIIGNTESKALVKLILAGTESAIENIAAAFLTLHRVHPFTDLKKEEFIAEIWKYLLDTLLVSGDAVYNEKAIIIYVIKRLALRFDKTAAAITTLLQEAFRTNAIREREDFTVGTLFNEVLVNMGKQAPADETTDSIDYYKDQPVLDENNFTNFKQGRLSDVLHYILQYGALPWWGYDYHSFSTSELITRLFETDAATMLVLLRKAFLKAPMKTRLFINMPANIARNLLVELPGGNDAILNADEFFDLLHESKLMRYHDREFVEKTIFSIASDLLGRSGYSLFPVIIFYFETITRLSAVLHITAASFIRTLMQAAEKISTPASTTKKNILQALLQHVEQLKITGTGIAEAAFQVEAEKTAGDPEILQLIKTSATVQEHFDFTKKTTKLAVQELTGLLQYFLQWNRLPDAAGILEKEEQKKLLREILMILFADGLTALTSLITGKANSIVARGYLTELFEETEGGKEKGMAVFLLQVNLPLFNLASAELKDENFSPQPEPGESAIALAEIFADEPAMHAEPGTRVMEGSKRLLSYFLKYRRFPDDIDLSGAGSMEQLLKEIMLFLFTHQPAFIKEQFQHAGALMAAKLYLYDLLAISHDTLTNKLKDLMQQIRETDLSSLVLQHEKGQEPVNKESWPAYILQMLQMKAAYRKEDHVYFLSSPAFAKMVLDNFGMELFLKIVAYKITWPFTHPPITQGWLSFLQSAISRNMQQEKIMDLFNQFNIIFIWGRLNIYNNDSYTIAFLNYLSDQLGTHAIDIFKQLFDHASHGAKQPVAGMEDQHHLIQRMLRTLVIKLEEIKKLDQEIISTDEKKLSAALKEEIMDLRKKQSEALKKEIWENTKTISEAGQEKDKEQKPGINDSIYIGNAGLVLFHPFLSTFFARTGLIENGEFKNEASKNRAVLLLQYLANGATENAEHELVLNKILCNVPLQEAIPVSFDITQQEREVTAELLEVFIERWDKLKNTSAEGLQNSFIMRQGMLNSREDHWNLKVEQRGYDILLQTLPWAFGYIKTPWMQHNLIVEWI